MGQDRRRPMAPPAWMRAVMHVCVVCAFLLVTGIVHAQGQKLAKLTLAGPSAAVSNALIHMVDSGALADLAEVVEFVPWRDAKVHVLTHALHYGSAVFEGERCYDGRIFKSTDHSQRLIDSGQ